MIELTQKAVSKVVEILAPICDDGTLESVTDKRPQFPKFFLWCLTAYCRRALLVS